MRGARRMAESAAMLVDEVFPEQPTCQWVLSVPYPVGFLCASRPAIMGRVRGIVYRCIFIARLAALVPKPRVNMTRFHRVFAPNSKHRARVTPAKRGRGAQRAATGDRDEPTSGERRASMSWAQRLKRVFGIDIKTCPACGGAGRIIVCIEYPKMIEEILTNLDAKVAEPQTIRLPPCRAPPRHGCSAEPDYPTVAVGLVDGATGKRMSAEPWSDPKTSFRATYQVRSTTDRLRRRWRGVTAAGRIGE